ncbi:MAG: hypothetical protein Q9220_002741 [cf. Caloplaca sp. 1 TL-2023]
MAPAQPLSAAQAHNAGQRLQALAYLQIGWRQRDVAAATGLTQGAISKLQVRARARGWNPEAKQILELEWVIDGERSGRPATRRERRAREKEEASRDEPGLPSSTGEQAELVSEANSNEPELPSTAISQAELVSEGYSNGLELPSTALPQAEILSGPTMQRIPIRT